MAEKKHLSANKNYNSRIRVVKQTDPVEDNHSEKTIYCKAVQQKRRSSSSEDGLDLSDESNLLNHLVLGEPEGEPFNTEPELSNNSRPAEQTGKEKEITPEENAANKI